MINSLAENLQYATAEGDKNRVAIIGSKGIALIDRKQAEALVDELIDIFDTFAGHGRVAYGEEMEDAFRKRHAYWYETHDANGRAVI